MQQLPAVDIAVLIVYLASVVAFGCWFVRRSRTTEGFTAASRSLPGWAVGLSIFGTYLSSNTFLGVPGTSFVGNWNRFVFSMALPIAALIAVKFFVPFYRKTGEISAYHHLERRFGVWARTYAMICYLLTQLARMGTIMYAVSLALSALVGWDNLPAIIVISGTLVTCYTLLGGIEAVIWTDVVQSIVLTAGAVIVTLMLLFGMPGGPGYLFETAAAQGKFSLGSFSASLSESTFWVVLVYGIVMNLNNFGIDQSFIQRYHTARDHAAAARSVWLSVFLYVPLAAIFLFIGTALFVYYHHPSQEKTLGEMTAEQANRLQQEEGISPDDPNYDRKLEEAVGDNAFPHFMANRLPPGMAGLLIAALCAAAMSSIDTSLNSSATIVLSDIYKRFFRPQAGERESMRVLYLATLVTGALGTGVAVATIGAGSVLDVWWKLSGIFAGGMLGLFLLGFIARRAGNTAALTGVTVGTLVIAWMALSPTNLWPNAWKNCQSPLHNFLIPVVGTATIVLVGFLIGVIVGRPENREKSDVR